MSPSTERTGPCPEAGPITTKAETSTWPGLRVLRLRRHASHDLDELLDIERPIFVETIDFHITHLDLDWRQRDHIGRELASAGWTP